MVRSGWFADSLGFRANSLDGFVSENVIGFFVILGKVAKMSVSADSVSAMG
jgi:hypothetical protein